MQENIVIERNQLRVRYHAVKLLEKLKEAKQIANSIELMTKLQKTPHLKNIEAFEEELKKIVEPTTIPAIQSKL